MVNAAQHHDEATANQSHGLACHNGSSDNAHPPGHPPQKPGAKVPVNTGVEGAAFFAPAVEPSSGTAFGSDKVPKLFEPWKLRDVEFKNRIVVSPMCQYSCPTGTGMPTEWHLVHQGQFSLRGASLVFTEAAAVLPNGRISPEDAGIWNDEQAAGWKRIVDFHHAMGAKAGLQLAHAGRKASTYAPWLSDRIISPPPIELNGSSVAPKEVGGWDDIWAPSDLPFSEGYPKCQAMTEAQIKELTNAFVASAKRAESAGYDVLEIHGAHGYLITSFLSPISNQRTDKYGGSLENRMRLAIEVTRAVRAAWPASKPLFFRVSATEWDERGEKAADGSWQSWGIEQTKILARRLKAEGVDLIDVSSGGNYAKQKIDIGPGYQVPFAKALKADPELEGVLISSVGLITDGKQAEEILQKGEADVVMLARELLRNASFVVDAAQQLDTVVSVPGQYQRGETRMFGKLHK